MTDKHYTLTRRAAERTAETVRRVLGPMPRVPKQTRRVYGGGAGGCESQNTIWDITVFGSPTGGTFDVHVVANGVDETITFLYNGTNSGCQTLMNGHSEVVSGDAVVTAGPFPNATMRIEWKQNFANELMPLPTVDYSALTGGAGRGVIVAMSQRGHS